MKCKEYINKIVENNGDMDKLSAILCESISMLDDEEREMMNDKLYVLAYGECIHDEMAEELVEEMKPFGEHWTLSQTTSVGSQYGFDNYSKASWYYVMNMLYNDYHAILNEDTSLYTKMARSFLLDEDGPMGNKKVYRYVTAMKD